MRSKDDIAQQQAETKLALRAELRRAGMNQRELAEALGITHTMANYICTGRCPIRAAVAVGLEELGMRTAVEWLTMQAAADVAKIKERASAGLASRCPAPAQARPSV